MSYLVIRPDIIRCLSGYLVLVVRVLNLQLSHALLRVDRWSQHTTCIKTYCMLFLFTVLYYENKTGLHEVYSRLVVHVVHPIYCVIFQIVRSNKIGHISDKQYDFI